MGRGGVKEGGLLSERKKVGLGYIRTILLKQLKQLKAGILHIHSEGKLIKSMRDRRLRTLCSTPFVRDSICTLTFHQTFFLSCSPLSELSRGRARRARYDSQLELKPTATDTATEREQQAGGRTHLPG